MPKWIKCNFNRIRNLQSIIKRILTSENLLVRLNRDLLGFINLSENDHKFPIFNSMNLVKLRIENLILKAIIR